MSDTVSVPAPPAGNKWVLEAVNGEVHWAFVNAATPVVTSIGPVQGPATGGVEVVINGSNFLSGSNVFFGSKQATSVHWDSNTSITVVAPNNVPGMVNVTVVTPSGTSAYTSAGDFTYVVS